MLSKYIAPALAVAGGAYAQCSVSATTTVTDVAGATALAGCATFTGSIAMASNASGAMTFDGLQQITGDFVGYDTGNVSSVSASTLTRIGGVLGLSNMVSVSSLNFPMLTSVGSINWTALGQYLQSLSFTTGIATISSISIADTYLQALTGISPTSASAITVTNNLYLTQIDLPLRSVSGEIIISANAGGGTALTLSDLQTAGQITISNVTSASLPALRNVTGLLTLTGNKFTTMNLPNVTSSKGLYVQNNDQMTNFTIPSYMFSSGDVHIQDNPALTGTLSLPALTRVDGAVNITGSFSDLSIPRLNSVLGALFILSTGNISSTCDNFAELKSSNVIQGSETCTSAEASTTSGGSTTSTTTTTSASSSTRTGAASSSYGQTSAITVFGLLAAAFGLLM